MGRLKIRLKRLIQLTEKTWPGESITSGSELERDPDCCGLNFQFSAPSLRARRLWVSDF